MEYTSRISNKLREMESGFKELLPPTLKGFIIKRQAKLTHDQAKYLHFYTPTRGLEADKMVDALNRLDQTDALVEQILGDRATLEHNANRGHAQSNSHAQPYPMRAETTASSESNHHHNHKRSSDTESDQLDWDPERIGDDGYPLVDEDGSTLVPVPREGPLEEPVTPNSDPSVATRFPEPSIGMPQLLCFSDSHLRTVRWHLFHGPSSRGYDVTPLCRFQIFL